MREMRRKDRRLTEDEARDLLRRGEYGVLAMVMPSGRPYSIPISYIYDEECCAVYMHVSAEAGQKMDNILCEPHVCLTVVTGTEVLPAQFATKYWSVNVFGTLHIVEDAAEKHHGLLALVRKYAAQYEEDGVKYIAAASHRVHVLKLQIAVMTGKARKK
nr:pyridoxamine 5'-phosphate oxidase family protein [uncultured Selenomonas sp.]